MNTARKNSGKKSQWIVLSVFFSIGGFTSPTSANQLVTEASSIFAESAGGGGNSGMPIVSADGRYVAFASTANNLSLTGGNTPILSRVLGNFNVYVRDRTNLTTTLVSLDAAGTAGGNGDSIPRGISANGQFVLFESVAPNLVAGDTNGTEDVFVRDLFHGTTTLVSVATNGFSGNAGSSNSVMTPDGRYVAFTSSANNLVPGDTNGIPDIFVRDLVAGTTTLVSVGAISAINSGPSEYSISDSPVMTPDGRYVVFYSTAINLVPSVRTFGEIYVRDVVGGTTTWASTGARGPWFPGTSPSNVVSCNYEISDDGHYIAYEAGTNNAPSLSTGILGAGAILRYGLQSGVTDLVSTNANMPMASFQSLHSLDMTPDGGFIAFVSNITVSLVTNNAVYLWDAQSGLSTLVSINTNGAPSPGAVCDSPAVSSNGQYVAFVGNATDLVTNPVSGDFHVYLRDVVNGVTKLLDGADLSGYGTGVSPATVPVMSADGSITVFESDNLLAYNRDKFYDVFAANRLTGDHELISSCQPLLHSKTPNGINGLDAGSVSSNGQFIAFYSDANSIPPLDTNGFRNIFVRNLALGTNFLVSVATNGVSGDGISSDAAISGDGRYVVFTSAADDLVAGDTNRALDVFVRDLQAQTTTLASLGSNGVDPGNGDSYSPIMSADGRYVLFRSKASNLAAHSVSGPYENLILRDLQGGTNFAVAADTVSYGYAVTPDLHYVAFIGAPPGYPANLYVWNSVSNVLVYTNTSGFTPGTLPLQLLALSANGEKLAYLSTTPAGLYVADLVSNTVSTVVSGGTFSSHATFQLSADGHYLAYSCQTSATAIQNVYLYDCQAGTNFQIDQTFYTLHGTNGNSDSPAVSPDGRYIAYRSNAGILVPDDFSPAENVFIYDRVNNATILASVDLSGNFTANDNSLKPVFSGDSQTLAFESWASDLATNDFNGGSDVFAVNLASLPLNLAGGGGDSSNSPPLYAQLILPGVLSSNLTVSWPLASGAAYQVEFKTNLNDPVWQVLPGAPAFIGGTGFIDDSSPAANQRFYRIILTSP